MIDLDGSHAQERKILCLEPSGDMRHPLSGTVNCGRVEGLDRQSNSLRGVEVHLLGKEVGAPWL